MFTLVTGLTNRLMHVSHHLGSGLTGVLTFGFVAYLLDIGGIRDMLHASGGLHTQALTAAGGVMSTFIGFNMLMKRLMGKHGVF